VVSTLAHADAIRSRDPLSQMAGLALDFVARMIPSPLGMFVVVQGARHYVLTAVKADPILGADPEVLAREYMAAVDGSDPILNHFRASSRANLVDTTRFGEVEGFENSQVSEQFFASYGLGPILILSLWDEQTKQRCLLILSRSKDENDFSEREKSFLRQAAPLLTQSCHCAIGLGGLSAPAPGAIAEALTARELEIAILAAHGYTNCQIGERLNIAPGTVKCHMHNVYSKLGIDSRVRLALVLGIPT